MRRIILLFLIYSIGINYSTFAQSQQLAVEILEFCEDNVGQRLAYKIREEIRKSSAFRLTNNDEARLQLKISSLSYDKEYNGATIYSVVWLLKSPDILPIYFDSTVGYVGSNKINEAAENIVAYTDRMIQELEKALNYQK